MFTFLIVVIAFIGLIMLFLVLVQSGKGGGLAGIAAGGATTQILGTRQAPDILEKATWILAVVFILLCILTNFTIDRGAQQESILQQGTQQQGTQPLAPLPQVPPAPQEDGNGTPQGEPPAEQPPPGGQQ